MNKSIVAATKGVQGTWHLPFTVPTMVEGHFFRIIT